MDLLAMLRQALMPQSQATPAAPDANGGGKPDLLHAAGLRPGSGLDLAKMAVQPMGLLNMLKNGGGTMGLLGALGGNKSPQPQAQPQPPPATPTPQPPVPTNADGNDFLQQLRQLLGQGAQPY